MRSLGPPELGAVPDRILVAGLRLLGRHGLLPEETDRAQPFEVDIELFLDLAGAAASDDLGASVDYGAVCEAARAVVEDGHARLMERLAEEVAARVLALAGERVQGVAVALRKLRPPVPYDLGSAGVRIYREARRLPAGAPGDRAEATRAPHGERD